MQVVRSQSLEDKVNGGINDVEIELTGNICSKLNTSGSPSTWHIIHPLIFLESIVESINYHMVVFVAPGTWFSWIQEREEIRCVH